MTGRRILPFTLLALAFALVALALWRIAQREPAVVAEAPVAEAQVPAEAEAKSEPLAPLRRQSVLVYFPGTEWTGLVGEEREIFGTAAPGDRAKQILSDLIGGPGGSNATRAVPPGTVLHQVYVLASGVAYIDFSEDLRRGLGGGSTAELLTVYAIVDSVALNVPEIQRVGILIDGKPIETLNGHVDLRRPLPPDRSYLTKPEAGAETIVVQAGGD